MKQVRVDRVKSVIIFIAAKCVKLELELKALFPQKYSLVLRMYISQRIMVNFAGIPVPLLKFLSQDILYILEKQ